MLIIRSIRGVAIRLTDERWEHITHRHPEMVGERDNILETISEPEMIQEGDFGALLAIRLFQNTLLGKKYIIVAYKEIDSEDGFILTAYIAREPSNMRKILWKR